MGHYNGAFRYLPSTGSELTFLVRARSLECSNPDESNDSEVQLVDDNIEELPMIGDVNLFLKRRRDDPD